MAPVVVLVCFPNILALPRKTVERKKRERVKYSVFSCIVLMSSWERGSSRRPKQSPKTSELKCEMWTARPYGSGCSRWFVTSRLPGLTYARNRLWICDLKAVTSSKIRACTRPFEEVREERRSACSLQAAHSALKACGFFLLIQLDRRISMTIKWLSLLCMQRTEKCTPRTC